jgi:hypothetical protein
MPRSRATLTAVAGVLLILAAVAIPTVGVGYAGPVGPAFASGETVAVTFGDGEKVVWGRDGVDDFACTRSSGQVQQASTAHFLDHAPRAVGGWHGLGSIHLVPAGTYELTCTTGTSGAVLAIDDPPPFYGPRAQAIALLVGMALGLAGAVLCLIGIVRRALSTRRSPVGEPQNLGG